MQAAAREIGEKTAGRWRYSGGWHYRMNNSSANPAAGWKELDGTRYYFDENGHMVTGEREIGACATALTRTGSGARSNGPRAHPRAPRTPPA